MKKIMKILFKNNVSKKGLSKLKHKTLAGIVMHTYNPSIWNYKEDYEFKARLSYIHRKFKAGLDYIPRPCLKNKKQSRKPRHYQKKIDTFLIILDESDIHLILFPW